MINIAKPCIGNEEKDAVINVMNTGMLACGEITTQFEENFSGYIGTKYGIATTSGTTALEVALRSLRLNEGDKVLTTCFSFIASTNAIIYAGLKPVFLDINEESYNIDEMLLEEAYKKEPDIKALLVVHLFGRPCNMNKICDFVHKHGLMLIEDCAQAHGAQINGRKVGTFGDVAAFSFYPTKNMTTGEGGMVVTDNPTIASLSRLLINHGMEKRYHHDIIGYNYRMTNIAAAIGICQLDKLELFNSKRCNNAKKYYREIKNELIVLPQTCDGHVFHQFTVKVNEEDRNRFVNYLKNKGIGYGIFYPLTIPEQKCYQEKGFDTEYKVANQIKKQVVSLPIHPCLSEEELEYVIRAVNEYK